jgi:formate dehydrogenase maturation protein FdhE
MRNRTCLRCDWQGETNATKCPTCASERSEDLLRLESESQDQGYVIIGCGGCRGYLKELDRRVRWNGQSALVEDWGSPHLDLIARRAGYRRPVPILIGLAQST